MTRRSQLLTIRLADGEMARLHDLAAAADVTMSGYVRASILAETGARSDPPRSPRSVAPVGAGDDPDDAPPAWADSDPRRLLRDRDRQARAVLARVSRGR
jgi:hypothetical protein